MVTKETLRILFPLKACDDEGGTADGWNNHAEIEPVILEEAVAAWQEQRSVALTSGELAVVSMHDVHPSDPDYSKGDYVEIREIYGDIPIRIYLIEPK